MTLVGNWGDQHDPRGTASREIGRLEMLQFLVEIRPKLTQPLGPLHRLIEPKKSEDNVRSGALHPVVGGAEVFGSMTERDLVASDGKVADHQFLIGKPGLDESLEPAGMLHTIGKGIADQDDVILGF